MKKILFIERQPTQTAVSIEKVFRQVAQNISKNKFSIEFQKLKFGNNLLGTFKNLLFFRKKKADIYHITGHIHYIALLLNRKDTVLTIHDVVILHIRKGLRRFVLKKLLFDLPLKKLDYVTAVSESTKKDLIKYCGKVADKVRVIENPLQEHFFAANKKIFNKTEPVILQIGTAANKNLPNLFEALENIKCRLMIIGIIDEKNLELLNTKKIKFENKTNLDNEQIKREYENADIVTFCSTFEGFGLPIIEAQAMKTPVVTSNLSPMREVAGENAALVDPNNYLEIRNAIVKLISDEAYRNKLVTEGTKNVERFRADKIGEQYENLYNEVLTLKQQS